MEELWRSVSLILLTACTSSILFFITVVANKPSRNEMKELSEAFEGRAEKLEKGLKNLGEKLETFIEKLATLAATHGLILDYITKEMKKGGD